MTIQFVKPETKRDYGAVAFHSLLAAIEAVQPTGPNVHNVVLQLREALRELSGKEADKPENLAWIWAVKTLSLAAGDMLIQARKHAPLSTKKEEAIHAFLDASTQFGPAEFDIACISNPASSPAFGAAKAALPELILGATTGGDLGLETLETRFAEALRAGSSRVICEEPMFFEPLERALLSIGGEGARRDAAWAKHSHWISSQFLDAPVFSTDDKETVPLSSLYLKLRCFWNEEYEEQSEDIRYSETVRNAHVADLHRTTNSWLSFDPKVDPIRVVTGGPGSGKSSFARAFAHQVICSGGHRVAFVRLQYTSLTGSLRDDIGRYFLQHDNRLAENGNPGLPANPLDWRKYDDAPLLLVFDGLDELTTNEDDGKRYAREFLMSLRHMLAPLNADGSPVRAIVLGRNAACEEALKTANIPLSSMLNVAPIAVMTRTSCRLSEHRDKNDPEDLFDPDCLMQIDQREQYWRRWAEVKQICSEEVPEPITDVRMSELNAEPLLLHLLINSRYCGEDWEIAARNRNYVYEDILEKIYDRNKRKEHFQSAGLSKSDFFDLMECLGIAAWRGNGRTGDDEDFRKVRKLHLNKEKRYKKLHSGELQSVALNIHTRFGGASENEGFEFIHKSFGEYLAARGLLFYGLRVARQLENAEPEDVEQQWTELFGLGELTQEIVRFLYDEALRHEKSTQAVSDKDHLTEFIDWVMEHGASAHRVFPDRSWRECERRQRCSESALVAITSAVACCCPREEFDDTQVPSWTINIKWPGRWLGTNSAMERIGVSIETPVQFAMRRLGLRKKHMWSANLNRADLSEADLCGCNLIRSRAIGANFSWAYLKYVNATYCDWVDAELVGANLQGADLSFSNLEGVIFDSANLSGVEGGHFSERGGRNNFAATLRSSDLMNTVFFSADLTGVDFSYSDLTNADFTDANLSRAQLTGANIGSADFSLAKGLSIEALNSANGDPMTELPDYIDPNEVVWLVEGD